MPYIRFIHQNYIELPSISVRKGGANNPFLLYKLAPRDCPPMHNAPQRAYQLRDC